MVMLLPMLAEPQMKLSSGTELFRKKTLVAEYAMKKFCGHLLE